MNEAIRTRIGGKLSGFALAAVAVAAVVSIGGCQFAPAKKVWPISWFQPDEEPGVPDRMMIVWSDTVLHQPQKPGVRGFGGRVYFYRGNETKPIKVDGLLTIYAYDSEDVSPDSTRPEKKFVFTEDQFAKHMSYTDMGASYSIWLPWDEIGGEVRQLSLVSRFDGRNGGVVISKPTIKLLPGLAKSRSRVDRALATTGAEDSPGASVRLIAGDDEETGNPPLQQASHSDAVRGRAAWSANRPDTPRTESMTIDLPPNFQRHLVDRRPSETAVSEPAGLSLPNALSKPRADGEPSAEAPASSVAPASSSAPASSPADDSAVKSGGQARTTGESNSRFSRTGAAFRNYADGKQSFQEQPTQTLNRPSGWLEPVERRRR